VKQGGGIDYDNIRLWGVLNFAILRKWQYSGGDGMIILIGREEVDRRAFYSVLFLGGGTC